MAIFVLIDIALIVTCSPGSFAMEGIAGCVESSKPALFSRWPHAASLFIPDNRAGLELPDVRL
jgi:hypothetical protein